MESGSRKEKGTTTKSGGSSIEFYIRGSVHSNSRLKKSNLELDWSVYTCLTQLYGGRDMYNLLHKEQLHVSALFIGHLQVDK